MSVQTMKVPRFSLDMKGDDRPDKTIGSALESRLPDTVLDQGARGVDTSTPVLRQNRRFGPRSGVKPKLCGHDMLPRYLMYRRRLRQEHSWDPILLANRRLI